MPEDGGDQSKSKTQEIVVDESKLYPADWKRLVPTCVRLNPADWNLFQTHPRLKNKMSEIVRDLVHNYLQYNGFSEVVLIEQIRDVDEQIRSLTGDKASMELQLNSLLTEKFQKEEGELQLQRKTLLVLELKVMWAEQLYILRKTSSLQSKERSKREDTDWVSMKLKGSGELKGHTDPPGKILNELEEIIKARGTEFEAKFKSQFSQRRKH